MEILPFLWTSAVLLFVPGPTNTLVCVGASQRGVRAFPALLAGELSGYASVVIPIGIVGHLLGDSFDTALNVLKPVAAMWVLVLAVHMWSRTLDTSPRNQVTSFAVFFTTLLNPKALVFALVLLPSPGSADYLYRISLLAGLMVAAASIWTCVGCGLVRARGPRFTIPVEKVAAIFLAGVSLSLIVSALSHYANLHRS
jgi:threonine/homoserine/homoserine lactone efflux protein